jgi:hypothetical protein
MDPVVDHITDLYGRLSVIEYVLAHVLRAAAPETKNPALFISQIHQQLTKKIDKLPESVRTSAMDLTEKLFDSCGSYTREYNVTFLKD